MPRSWSTKASSYPGVKPHGRRFIARFCVEARRHYKRCWGWYYLGTYPNAHEAGRVARDAAGLPMVMRKRLARCRPATARRRLLKRMVRLVAKVAAA